MLETTSYQKLLNLLAQNVSLQELVEACAQMLENPLQLLDSTFEVLTVSSTHEIKDEIWADAMSGRARSKRYEDEKFTIRLMREVMRFAKPILTDYNGRRSRRIVSRVAARGRILGYIVCLEEDTPFPTDILLTTATICDVLAIELQRMHSYALPEREPYSDALKDVLMGKKEISQYSATFWGTVYGDNTSPHTMLCVPWAAENLTREQIAYVQSHLQLLGYHVRVTDLDGDLALLVPLGTNKLSALLDRFASLLESYHLRCGVSECFTNVLDIRTHYQQARCAVETGARLSDKTICRYEEFMLDDLLRHLASDVDLTRYRSVAIQSLRRYDAEHKTEYLQTLKTYLCLSGNISAVAEELYTHRNTIVHRIERIKKYAAAIWTMERRARACGLD